MRLREYRQGDAQEIRANLVEEAVMECDQSQCAELMDWTAENGWMWTLADGQKVFGSAGCFDAGEETHSFFFLTRESEGRIFQVMDCLRTALMNAKALGKPVRALLGPQKAKAARLVRMLGFRKTGTTEDGFDVYEAR